MNIGVFDSGLGGLTILKAFLKKLPQYNYVYLGDSARVPYGNRSPEIIYGFTKQAVNFLFKKNCQMVIIACNTSSATALKKIQQEYLPEYYPDRKVLGIIKPITENLSNSHQKIGVIGTKATVDSGAFVREIKKTLPNALVFQQACPLLVPFIEEGVNKHEKIMRLVLKEYLDDLIKENIDTLVLACTHYEFLKKEIRKIVGPKINVISEGKIAAEKLKDFLSNHPDIEKILEKKKQVSYFVTDFSPDYERLMKLFLESYWYKEKVQLVKIDK
jgi:glutamate racemase